MNPRIHPTAIVADSAVLGEGTSIGPFSIIGPKVRLGKDNRIYSHVVIEGNTEIGDHNQIFQFASIGSAPQDLKFKGEDTLLKIGNSNIIREYVTLQPGTSGGGGVTLIENENLFMASSHVGHDSKIGSRNIVANSAAISGHVTVGNKVTIGGMCGIHQFVRLGDFAFLGGGAMVTQDIPPYCIAQGDRAGLAGVNIVGLKRAGFQAEEIGDIKSVFRTLFLSKEGVFRERVDTLASSATLSLHQKVFIDFILSADSGRGIATVRKSSVEDV